MRPSEQVQAPKQWGLGFRVQGLRSRVKGLVLPQLTNSRLMGFSINAHLQKAQHYFYGVMKMVLCFCGLVCGLPLSISKLTPQTNKSKTLCLWGHEHSVVCVCVRVVFVVWFVVSVSGGGSTEVKGFKV